MIAANDCVAEVNAALATATWERPRTWRDSAQEDFERELARQCDEAELFACPATQGANRERAALAALREVDGAALAVLTALEAL